MGLKSFLGFCFAKYIVYKNKKWKNNAIKYQEKTLFSLIKQAKNTCYGVDHNFKSILTPSLTESASVNAVPDGTSLFIL